MTYNTLWRDRAKKTLSSFRRTVFETDEHTSQVIEIIEGDNSLDHPFFSIYLEQYLKIKKTTPLDYLKVCPIEYKPFVLRLMHDAE